MHPHSEDDWLQGCPIGEDSHLEDLSKDVVKGDSSFHVASSWQQLLASMWTMLQLQLVSDDSFHFAVPINNNYMYTSLAVECILLHPGDADSHEVIKDSSYTRLNSMSWAVVVRQKQRPTDL